MSVVMRWPNLYALLGTHADGTASLDVVLRTELRTPTHRADLPVEPADPVPAALRPTSPTSTGTSSQSSTSWVTTPPPTSPPSATGYPSSPATASATTARPQYDTHPDDHEGERESAI